MTLTWSRDLPAESWDRHLAAIGGHPLQSALWGDARQRVDGIRGQRWAAFAGGEPVLLARFESRRIARFGRVAWLPRGPASGGNNASEQAFRELLVSLRAHGYLLCIDDRYRDESRAVDAGTQLYPKPRTAWIDLTLGLERLSNAKWRYGIRTAQRAGVRVEQTRDSRDVAAFFALCSEISALKNFDLPGSEALFQTLVAAPASDAAEARLFVARLEGALAAAALVIRCGRSVHYFWGGVDRRFPRQRASEAVQWAVIEWAVSQGLERYDLEGIDQANNPGTYKFKMEMGAAELELPGRCAYPLNAAGRAALHVGRWTGRL